MARYHIAQINIARMLAQIEDPMMAAFVAQLAPVNPLADETPGFIWRLQSESGDATGIKVYDDDMIIINLMVWENIEALREYVYKGAHHAVLRDWKRRFEKFEGFYYALWWMPAGHLPTADEGSRESGSVDIKHVTGDS